jgi:hypothetical protein
MAGMTALVPNSLQPTRGAEPSSWQATVGQAQAKPTSWEKFTGLFKTPMRTDGDVVKAQVQFGADFQRQVSTLGRDLSPQARAGLEASANAKFSEIVRGTLDQARNRDTGQVSLPVLRQAITGANELAGKALMQLQVEALRAKVDAGQGRLVDIRPQAVVRHDGTINVIRQAPQIENMVFRGGGAKGIGTGPALIEMENAGMLSGLQRVAGTSVGGLVAICLASGHSAAQMQDKFGNIDMPKFTAKAENFEALYPQVSIEIGTAARMLSVLSHQVGNHASGAMQMLDQASAESVAGFLKQNWNTEAFQTKLAAQGPEAALRMGQLRDQNFATDRTDQMITFRDLNVLHAIDPSTFKELTLTGFERGGTNATKYFDFNSTPDMPIALAGRISMSLPQIFGDVNYDMGDGRGTQRFQDGGAGSNIPAEAVFQGVSATGGLGSGQATAETRARTAVVAFDEQGKAYTALHTIKKPEKPIPSWLTHFEFTKNVAEGARSVKAFFKALPKQMESAVKSAVTGGATNANEIDTQKFREAGPNGLVVFHGNLKTTDFSAEPLRAEFAKLGAQMKMLEQVEQRQHQAYAVEYGADQAAACFDTLNDTERAALVASGPPERPRSGASNPAANFQMALYEMAMAAANPQAYNATMRDALIA